MRRAALLVCFCWPCVFGQVMHVIMLTEGQTAAVPDQPFLPMARVAALWKRPPHKHSLPKTECGICSTKEAASNILAELSSMWLLSMKPLRGKRFPNNFPLSCWNLAWKKKKKKKTRGALHIHTCRRASTVAAASLCVSSKTLTKVTNNFSAPVNKRSFFSFFFLKKKTALMITLPSS